MSLRMSSSLILLLAVASAATAGEIPDYPFIFVVGKADIDTPPNIATCTLLIRDRETEAVKATSSVEDRLKMVLKTLDSNKIAASDIESSRVEKQSLTDDSSEGKKQIGIVGYDVWRHVKFTVRQLDAVPPIEGAMLRAPNVTDFDCQFNRSDRAKVEDDLTTRALASAREQAEKMTGPLGRHVVAPVAISKVPLDSLAALFGVGGDYRGLEAMDRIFKRSVTAELRGDELLVPATIHLAMTVNVLFKME
jgi:uncharacterized protein